MVVECGRRPWLWHIAAVIDHAQRGYHDDVDCDEEEDDNANKNKNENNGNEPQ